MHRFKRRGGVISTDLSADEVAMLDSLLHELIELVAPGEPQGDQPTAGEESDDPFEAWAAELGDQGPVETPDDPVLRRLLPDAYPDDPKASAEFRRFTDRDLRRKKVADAEVALRHLAATDGGQQDLRIPIAEAGSWLRVLTSLRLAVAGRLGITDNDSADAVAMIDDDDPRAFMVSIYDWLGFAQETLVSAL
ncbi:hypothetical protein GCM10011575_17990 [Microlunatus endophyticus]|uniref:DUF2017 domain-containing protein n=1 Tax=Microlunatus endophyticus TaxID=1716077 RepID=A0A917S7K2_9ACTN|nr:DUF2017 domain-containing protein [Microlunatus endophyticus]GGL59880.1 hypothetical protein GCM10011575_17990 [Microlunatus endophyticus]